MKFLIAEEALIDRKGHWFEYITTISNQFRASGDEVRIAANSNAVEEILTELKADAVFPKSAWGAGDKAKSSFSRLRQLLKHNGNLFKAAESFVEEQGEFDVLFVPTILIDHILGWRKFAKKHAGKKVKKIVLFFVNGQGTYQGPDKPILFQKSPNKFLFKYALSSLKKEVENGTVLLGCETREMAKEYESFCGLPFHYLPHAVNETPLESDVEQSVSSPKTFSHLGFSRFEKGSDLLQQAIIRFFENHPEANVRFLLQWVTDFAMEDGSICRKEQSLLSNPKVEFIDKALNSEEYKALLQQTDVMVLPYRPSSYYARVSRVAIEAAINSVPMIYTKDSWNESLVLDNHGAGIGFDTESVDSLYQAIEDSVNNMDTLKAEAEARRLSALKHYSAATFESYLKSLTGFSSQNTAALYDQS